MLWIYMISVIAKDKCLLAQLVARPVVRLVVLSMCHRSTGSVGPMHPDWPVVSPDISSILLLSYAVKHSFGRASRGSSESTACSLR